MPTADAVIIGRGVGAHFEWPQSLTSGSRLSPSRLTDRPPSAALAFCSSLLVRHGRGVVPLVPLSGLWEPCAPVGPGPSFSMPPLYLFRGGMQYVIYPQFPGLRAGHTAGFIPGAPGRVCNGPRTEPLGNAAAGIGDFARYASSDSVGARSIELGSMWPHNEQGRPRRSHPVDKRGAVSVTGYVAGHRTFYPEACIYFRRLFGWEACVRSGLHEVSMRL